MSYRHKSDCQCELCQAAKTKLQSDERIVLYGIKVPLSLRESLKTLGAARVREALEKIVQENA